MITTRMHSPIVICLFTLLMYTEDATCQRRSSRYFHYYPYYQSHFRRNHRPRHNRIMQSDSGSTGLRTGDFQASPSPNICPVKEVMGTGEQCFEECARKRPRRICDRPTIIRNMCCSGYGMVPGERGCPKIEPLENIVDTAKSLKLDYFVKVLTNTEIDEQLKFQGAYTAFIPRDLAFKNLSYADRNRLHPWTWNAPSLLHYHILPGRYNYSMLRRHEEVESLYYGQKPVRLNKYSLGVATINCAKIILPNQIATNGIVHVIDRMIKPLDVFGDLADVMLKDNRFTKFAQVIYTANLITMLQSREKHYTIFAPDDSAFERLHKTFRKRLLRDKAAARAVVNYHIVEGVFCGASTVVTSGLKPIHGQFLTFRCKYNGNYINNARLTEEDINASNGVVHIINKVLIPDAIKDMIQLARELKLFELIQGIYRAGFHDKLQTKEDFTLFAPSDEAFSALPEIYKEALKEQPGMMEHLIDYHTVDRRIKSDELVGDMMLETGIDAKLKVNVYRNGITVDNAHIKDKDQECGNGIIHIIDKVLIPPELNLLELIGEDRELSHFLDYIKKAKLTSLFTKKDGKFTVLAPTNTAFGKIPDFIWKRCFQKEETLKSILQRHIINRIVVSSGLTPESIYTLPSLTNEDISFKMDKTSTIFVNKYSKALSTDKITLNGVIFRIDRVLHSACNVTYS